MAGFFRRIHQWRGQEAGGIGVPGQRRQPHWVVVESVASPALGSVYAQVLQQAGIPVLTKEWGAGAGAMGGASTGVRVLVPEDRLDEARGILAVGSVGSEGEYE